MSTVPLRPEPFLALIAAWLDREQDTNPVIAAIEHDPTRQRWYVRMHGEEKLVTTVWLTLREMTLHVECYFMPAPEEDRAACYEYLLRTNRRLFGLRFAIGEEDAIYLVGQLPLSALAGVGRDGDSSVESAAATSAAQISAAQISAAQISAAQISAAESELDRLLGAAYAYSEECFRTAMSIGFGSRFRG